MRSARVGAAVAGPLLALVMSTSASAAPASTSTTTDSFAVSIEVLNPCTGEPVLLQGTARVTEHVTSDAAGGFTGNFYSTFSGRATGLLTGTVYRVQTRQMDNQTHIGSAGATETTGMFSTRYVATAGEPGGFRSSLVYHYTQTPTGTVFWVENRDEECGVSAT
jgi:hypothetical protein